jgi:hypothetical protein
LRTWSASFWKGRLETTPSAEIGRVYVFGSFHDYNKLLTGGALHGAFRPAGHYSFATDMVALYIGSIERRDLPDILVHEGAHMLVAREILRGRPTALWLAEGLATYFEGTARTASGSFETGVVAGRRPKQWVKDFRKLLDGGPAWSVETLLRTDDPQAFYGEKAQQQYAASWLLVHALFHAEGGKTAAGFARFIGRAGEDASPEALYAAVGLDAAALTALVVAHQRALDVR